MEIYIHLTSWQIGIRIMQIQGLIRVHPCIFLSAGFYNFVKLGKRSICSIIINYFVSNDENCFNVKEYLLVSLIVSGKELS